MDQKDKYSPCPCGSGKKFKFCCYQKESDQPEVKNLAEYWTRPSEDAIDKMFPRLDKNIVLKVLDICQEGLRLMASGHYKEALPLFKKAVPVCADVYTPANNLALCQFVTGALGDAIKTQRKSLKASSFANPFGLVSLATFCYVSGDEDEARSLLDEAVGLKPPSPDACIKVCEGLSRFKRHQDLLDYADASGYGDHAMVSFYTGVAAANLGDEARAMRDLKRVSFGSPKADLARRYLDNLRSGSVPNTVLGDWPALGAEEVCPLDVIEAEIQRVGNAWLERRIFVDVCEGLLNYKADSPDDAFAALCGAKHPEATVLLSAIAKGRFGSDSLRIRTMRELQSRGELDSKKPVNVFLGGKFQEAEFRSSCLNSDLQFGGKLPAKWDKLYETSVEDARKKRPNWKALEAAFLKIMEAAPTYYPARYNYAVALVNQNRFEEAKPIFQDLTTCYPAYLFAPAALLQVLTFDDRIEEARALIKSIASPEETHPEAFVAWLLAQYAFHSLDENFVAAEACINQAYEIDPKDARIREIRKKFSL